MEKMTQPEFSHKAIYGMTKMGKTWLLKRIAKKLIKYKQKVIVYTASGDISFPKGCKITACEDELEYWLGLPENYRSHVMLDEGASIFEETSRKSHPNIWTLFRMGRHKGYTAYIATQYPTSIPRRVRVNCGECYCFRLGDEESAKLVHRDYNSMKINGIPIWKKIQGFDVCNGVHLIQPLDVQLFKLK